MKRSRARRLAILSADIAANQQLEGAIARKREARLRTTHTGFYIGGNATQGLHRVRLDNGGVAFVTAIANSGKRAGARVFINRPHGSPFGTMKSMSR